MFVFKLFTINNILFYVSYFILVLLLLFLSYKYLYLEHSNYMLSSRLNKLEIELNGAQPITNTPASNYYNEKINHANEMMNTIFNDVPDKCCSVSGVCEVADDIQVTIIDEKPVKPELFDLKKEIIDDNASVISSNVPVANNKKALMKLSLDKIKAKCEERKINADGTKSQLIEKIIAFDNSKVVEDEVITTDE